MSIDINNFCLVSEANYLNYVKRIKQYSLQRYLELDLNIPFYISTNLPSEFREFDNHPFVRVFDINHLRRHNIKSINNEILPTEPKDLYPNKYPWNLRRFILRKAAEDGYLGLIFTECDTKISDFIDKKTILDEFIFLYEENTVKTSTKIFDYDSMETDDMFVNHKNYINELNLKFEKYITLDGGNQLFFGKNKESLLKFFDCWDYICDYGYEKIHGYKNNYLSNLSFILPMTNFSLKFEKNSFITQHVYSDRY